MKIDLSFFEQIVNPTILKRGLQYFKQGKVLEVFVESEGEITATVDGSEGHYTTTIKKTNDIIVENVCSCPYDMGPICKHTVALIFHLKQEELGIKVKAKSSAKPKIKSKSKSEKEIEQIEQLIENATKEQLGEYVKRLCVEDRAVRQGFIAQHQPKDSAVSKSDYKSSLTAYANSLKRHGYIDYRNARSLEGALDEVCRVAEQRLESKDYISAINAACAVLELATKAIDYTDDSDGCVGDPIRYAMQILNTIANQETDEPCRNYLLKYAFKSYESDIFNGWDWHEDMLGIALYLVRTDSEKSKLQNIIESQIEKDKDGWREKSNKELMAKFLGVTQGEDAKLRYMRKNIGVDKFRELFVKNAIEVKDYQEAIRLVEEVSNVHKNRHDDTWRRYLLEIYTLMGDKRKVIKFSRDLLLSTSGNIDNYYTILKNYVPKQEWNGFIATLYVDVKESLWSNDKLTNLAIWEADWDMYIDILRKSLRYDHINEAEKMLPIEFLPQLVAIYRDAILKNMESKVGRSHYQNAARSIRRMIKLGERQIAEELIEELRSKYKMRRALIEELDNV